MVQDLSINRMGFNNDSCNQNCNLMNFTNSDFKFGFSNSSNCHNFSNRCFNRDLSNPNSNYGKV